MMVFFGNILQSLEGPLCVVLEGKVRNTAVVVSCSSLVSVGLRRGQEEVAGAGRGGQGQGQDCVYNTCPTCEGRSLGTCCNFFMLLKTDSEECSGIYCQNNSGFAIFLYLESYYFSSYFAGIKLNCDL